MIMYKIKSQPEDFIVKEITNVKLREGDYSIFLLKKKDYTTIKAIKVIANKLKIKSKRIGFAGIKDKRAVTEQYISIFRTNIRMLELKDIELKYIGKYDKPLSPGDLKGNEFIITIKNLNNKEINKFKSNIRNIKIPNYFGEQRFSKYNKEIGKNIINDNFKKAVNLIIRNDREYRKGIKEFLKKNRNNYIGALKLIPIKILRLYVHSYQSYLWNKTVEDHIKKRDIGNIKNIEIPIIGFGTEIEDKDIEDIINKILKKEKVNPREFIIRKIPELSSEGSERKEFIDIKNFKYRIDKDKIKLNFFLPKGCYATTVIRYLFK